MESSNSSLSSDWDLINYSEDLPEESVDEISDKASEEPAEEVLNKSPDEPTHGPILNAWTNAEEEYPLVGSGVHVLDEPGTSNHDDSNSSSDIDIIDENPDDMTHSGMGMLISPVEYLNSSPLESGPIVSAVAPNVEDGWNGFLLTHRWLRNPQFKDYLIVIFISLAVASTLHLQNTPEDKMKQMREEVAELKKENSDLKNQVISKIEDDKLFLILEEQIMALKMENIKLSGSLQSLITHLEEQTALIRKESEVRDDPFKLEIDQLKERVNLLQIDNEELQQQLVLMRYGAHSPLSETVKAEEPTKTEPILDQKENKTDNLTDALTEEIQKLKKKLYSEVDELKDWKESINNLIRKMNAKEQKSTGNKGQFENKKSREDNSGQQGREETNEKSNKEQKSYDWSWKDFKKNIRGTLDNIRVSKLFSKYINVDKKKVEDVFESVGQYFKKAQDKAKKIINPYKDKARNEVWEFLGELRNKWATMKDEYFDKQGPVPPSGKKENVEKNQPPNLANKQQRFESEGKKSSKWAYDKEDKVDQPLNKQKGDTNKENLMTFEELEDEIMHIVGDYPYNREKYKKYVEHMDKMSEQGKEPDMSWLFDRAAIRSSLREQDKEEEPNNWFWRRKTTGREWLDISDTGDEFAE